MLPLRLFVTRCSAAVLAIATIGSLRSTPLQAQAVPAAAEPGKKRVMTIDDYPRWRDIEGAQISADGQWVAYATRLTNVATADTKPMLHLVNVPRNQDVTVADGSNPSFSQDSRWLTYSIDAVAPRGGRGGRSGGAPATPAADSAAAGGRGAATPPPQRRVEVRELATGTVRAWQDIQTATFSPTASHLLLRRRATSGSGAAGGAPGGAAGGASGGRRGGAAVAPVSVTGTDALLLELSTGRVVFLGSVNDAAFSRKGEYLAYTVGATVLDGNGLFVIDLKAGTTHAIDNDARIYSRLAFNDDGSGIAVLKGVEVAKMRERDNQLVVVPNLRAALTARTTFAMLDPKRAANFPKGFVVSDRATLSWSDDNARVFFGVMPQTAALDSARRTNPDSVANVDVWRAEDERVQSLQMARADADRNFTFRSAFDVAVGSFVRLADSTLKEVDIAPDGAWAVGRDTRAFISDYERARADLYRVNVSTGERTVIRKATLIGPHAPGFSSNGKHYLLWLDGKFQDYDLATATLKALGAANTPSFANTQFDHPGPRPSFGVAGYAKDGSGVIVEHRFDLWLLPYNGSAPKNLTLGVGSKQEIKFVPVRTEAVDPMAARADRDARAIDLSASVTLSAYGEWTKKAGLYQLADGKLSEVIYEDAAFSTPVKAAKSDRYLFTRQTFAEFPDLRVASASLKDAKKVSDVNPQQAELFWGRRVLFDYQLKDGQRAQGILAVPDDYKTGEKRPMLVTFYEKNSANLHHYSAPSYLTGMGSVPMEAVSRGYVTMLPDIYFHTGMSHSDMLDAVESATKKVIALGYADPKHIGLNGHSYGGEGAGFIATRSKLFAAVGVGAGVSDLFSDFSQSWGWSYQNMAGASGQNAFDYYLYDQGRWGFSPWDKPDVYHFESSLTHVPDTQAAVLMMHGTADPTVSFQEGLNFYSALRYNKKDATLLAYLGEPHGLRGIANRKDLTLRYFQFFDHYLKGAPKPEWMTKGVPFLVKEADGVKAPK